MARLILPPINEADGVHDELQAWFLARAEAEGWVYTSVLRQLVNCMYRDRDYLEKRRAQGHHTAYDYAVDRDLKALAWAIPSWYATSRQRRKPNRSRPSRRASPRAASVRPSGPDPRGDQAGTASPSATGRGPSCRRAHYIKRRSEAGRPD
jgi:hypothetical protein